MLLAASEIADNPAELTSISQLLDVPLSLVPIQQSPVSHIQRQRLQLGQQLLIDQDDGRLSVLLALSIKEDEFVLTGEFSDFRSSHIRGTAGLLRKVLKRRGVSLQQLIHSSVLEYSLPIRILSSEEVSILALNKQAMTAPDHIAKFDIQGMEGRFYTWLPEAQQFIELGPYVFHQGFSYQSILVVLLWSIVLSGIAVYWLVHRFEINLQRLERASSRIAAGHLNSRVKVVSQDTFGRLGDAFNGMAEQIQRLMNVQKEMIRAVSHELRTPVARMRFGVQMLEDSTQDSYLQKQLADMDQDLQELDELVDEILTYAKLEEGGPILEFKAMNMLDLLDQIVEETRRRTDRVSINFNSTCTNEAHIFSDIEYRYMHRAIQNLVGNACRYAKSQVLISYHYENQFCRIDVEDDGSGIPEKDWLRVFSPFTRLDDSRTRASGGYGLGLSIVQRIIFWHGGKASVGRSHWQGAKMTLQWPKNHY